MTNDKAFWKALPKTPPESFPGGLMVIEAWRGETRVAVYEVEPDKFIAAERGNDEKLRPLTPVVSMDQIRKLTELVLCGDTLASTWQYAVRVLAMGMALTDSPAPEEAVAAPLPIQPIPPADAVIGA